MRLQTTIFRIATWTIVSWWGFAESNFAEDKSAEQLFRSSVWPLLEESCQRCHGPEKQKGDLRLDSLEAALHGGKSGAALVPGKPSESLMLQLARHQDADRPMPPKEDLPPSALQHLEQWIAAGAPWPDMSHASQSAAVPQTTGHIGDAWHDSNNPITKLFGGKRLDLWSMQPIGHPTPPQVKDADWVRTPIDAFVLARLEASHVSPAPEAPLATLARRVYFDLTGLPPTPEEMQAFLSDPDPHAYEHLVDKLLNSPHYGEEWGRMWLDVVRYSDSEGFDWDEFRRQAWRFRDYVIRSFNQDKPFNRFICEQLAGDEMVGGDPQTAAEQDCLIGTGYLLLGPFDNSAKKFGESARAHFQMLSDLVETTGAAFLGLNFSCCRCHDHKFDPISQADYYRMRAFFEGVATNDSLTIDLAAQKAAIQHHNAAIEAKIAEHQKKMDEMARPIETRLREENLAHLSAYDKALLKLPREQVDAAKGAEIDKVYKDLEPNIPEIRAALAPKQRALFLKEGDQIDQLEGQLQNFTQGLVASDYTRTPPTTRICFQGDHRQPRDPVAPGILSIFDPNPLPPAHSARATSGRRLALAQWIASESNPLTARVIVNRIWQGHFGEGIQATANDFGMVGARPSHPELLDWLATEFMRNGWSIKKLHRLILLSSTYRQGLSTVQGLDKHLFASQAPRRLAAEPMRDAMLAVSGKLLMKAGGTPAWPDLPEEIVRASPALIDENKEKTKGWYPSPSADLPVRSIYLIQKRNVHIPMMETLDLPENSLSCPRRNVSTVAPQALTLLNSRFAADAATHFAERLAAEISDMKPETLVDRGFVLALQRSPEPAERAECVQFLEHHSLAEFCRILLNLNEFAYVD